MTRCRVCKENEAIWAWQPFGPAVSPNCFALLGNHYRGFAVIKICDECKRQFQVGNALVFTFKYILYRITKTTRERHDLEKSWIEI